MNSGPNTIAVFAVIVTLGIIGIFSTTPLHVQDVQAAADVVKSDHCNIGNQDEGGVYVEPGRGHFVTNDNGEHVTCIGQADVPPTDGGARVFKSEADGEKCHGVATPSGQGQYVCNRNDNK